MLDSFLKVFEEWFAGYTAEIRSRISGASIVRSGSASEQNMTEWGWDIKELPAVLDEVDLKIEHTYRVRDRCREIAESIIHGYSDSTRSVYGFSDRDVEIASVIGLLHDLGRFRQALMFGTMDDRITGNHGEMSADIFTHDVPKTGLNKKEIQIITDALRYHNVYKLPAVLTKKGAALNLLFTQIVRDGDKLDIFKFYASKENNTEGRAFRFIMSEGEGDYSPDMLAGVLKAKNLKVSGIRNKKDRKLMQVSLVYDMNFDYSFRWMLKKDYLAHITGVANGSADDVMQRVYDYATEWMRGKINDSHDETISRNKGESQKRALRGVWAQ